MTTMLMDPPPLSPGRSAKTELSVQEIIRRGRSRRPAWRGAWGASLLSAGLMWASFTPLDWGPLGWVCLVPLMQIILLRSRTAWMYSAVYVGGLAFWVPTLQWMRLGDSSMYVAWLALAFYLACYWPAFVWLSRGAVHRMRAPLFLAAPVVWVGLEYIRGYMVTGFSWYLLAHSQYRFTTLVQISDLCGAYLLSFLMVLCAAAFATVVPHSFWQRLRVLPSREVPGPDSGELLIRETPRRMLLGVITGCLLFFSALGYGMIRRSQADFEVGPRVGLVQGNFRARVKSDPQEWVEILSVHRRLTSEAVTHHPDVIIWPESMFRDPIFEVRGELTESQLRGIAPMIPVERWTNDAVQQFLQRTAEEARAYLVIGMSWLTAHKDRLDHFNSAVLVDPVHGVLGRYDKIHLVPFGEFIPLQATFPWLSGFTPYGYGFGLTHGQRIEVFEVRGWKLLPLICFEDTVPHLVRGMVASARQTLGGDVDCLINLTNDGWFVGSNESEQHLITAQFRCVETRTPMARAVNTGISAVIDGDGVVREPVAFFDLDHYESGEAQRTTLRDPATGAYHRELNAALVVDIPLDRRSSLYVVWGDWFAALCLAGCCSVLLWEFVSLLRRRGIHGSATTA